ncbi:gliding motility-associated C-terminal domain-containing protein [bacterium SCSIO 12643]|nr:gliding motility-associated C-terminal domain-containing protein [bacterium SCSIO 12643]
MKRLILVLLSFLINFEVIYSQCDISYDYSSGTGWTQIGTNVQISNGQVEFLNGAADGSQRRVYRGLGHVVNDTNCWNAEFTFLPQSVGSYQGQPFTGHVPFALTAGTQDPFSDCPNIPCTGYPVGTQEGIIVLFGANNPPTGDLWFKIKIKDNTSEYTSSNQINIPQLGIPYYMQFEKTFSDVHLHVFLDSGKTIPLPGSPISLAVPSTVDGLHIIQHAAVARGYQLRQLTGTVDDLCIDINMGCQVSIPIPGNKYIDSADICVGDSVKLLDNRYQINQWAEASNPQTIISTNSTLTVSPSVTTIYLAYGINDTTVFKINVHSPPFLYLGTDTSICLNSPFTLNTNISNASFLWQNNSSAPFFNVTTPGKYWVTVNKKNCIVSDTIMIDSIECKSPPKPTQTILELPNIFTPNGDLTNDFFVPVTRSGITSMHTVIYNRWGVEIYQSNFLDIVWDGYSFPSGTYFWVIDYVDINNISKRITGDITLIR